MTQNLIIAIFAWISGVSFAFCVAFATFKSTATDGGTAYRMASKYELKYGILSVLMLILTLALAAIFQ